MANLLDVAKEYEERRKGKTTTSGSGGGGGGGGNYTVKQGDTLSSIAERSGTNVLDLIAQNPQFSNPNYIRPGQRVRTGGPALSPEQRSLAANKMLSNPLPGSLPKKTLDTSWEGANWRERIMPYYMNWRPPVEDVTDFKFADPWDNKTANAQGLPNQAGEVLPPDALGWAKDGRPVFGTGINNWFKQWDWSYQKGLRRAEEKETALGQGFAKVMTGFWHSLGAVADAVVGGSVRGIERLLGAAYTFQETGEGSLLGAVGGVTTPVPEKRGDIFEAALTAEAVKATGVFPGADKAAEIINGIPLLENVEGWMGVDQSSASFLDRMTARMQNINEFAAQINPGTVIYNMWRTATSPVSTKDKKAKAEAGWQAGRIMYSQAADPAIRSEFMRRYRAGEDPALVAAELENPTAEFVGQMILDPLNIFMFPAFARSATESRRLGNTHKIFKPSLAMADEIKNFRTGDMAESIESITRLSRVAAEETMRIVSQRADDYRFGALTDDAKRAAMSDVAGGLALHIADGYEEADDAIEVYTALARRASGVDDAEATARLMALTNRGKLPAEILFSPASYELGYALKQIGAGTPEFMDDFARLAAAGDKADLATHIYGKFDDITKKIYPSAAEKIAAGEDLPAYIRGLEKFKDNFGGVYRLANNFFAHVYMGMSTGYAMRNALMDNFLTMLDIGPTNPLSASRWHGIGEKWMGGVYVRAAKRGISSPLMAADVRSGQGFFSKLFGQGIKLAEKVEQNSSMGIVGKTIDSTMRKLLYKGLPTLDPLVRAGLGDDAARFLVNATISNGGDFRSAANALRGRRIQVWQHINEWADPQTIEQLGGMGLLPHVEDILSQADDVDGAVGQISSLFDELIEMGQSAVAEAPVVSRSARGFEDVVSLGEMEAADMAQTTFTAVIQANENAMAAAEKSIAQIRKMVFRAPPDVQQTLMPVLRRYTVSDDTWSTLQKFAYDHSTQFADDIARIKGAGQLDLAEEWDRLGMTELVGQKAAWLNDTAISYRVRKREFLNLAHEAFVENKRLYWGTIRDALYKQADDLFVEISDLYPEMDATLHAAAFKEYQNALAVELAFPFDDGLHFIRDRAPRHVVGGETIFGSLADGIPSGAGGDKHLLNIINMKDADGNFVYRQAGAGRKIFKDLTEVNSQVALDALWERRRLKALERANLQLFDEYEALNNKLWAGVATDADKARMGQIDEILRPSRMAEEVAEAAPEAGRIKPLVDLADDEAVTIYQGRPAGFDPAGGYSTSWTRDPDFAQNYAGPRGQIYEKQVTGAEWRAAVGQTAEEGALFASSEKAAAVGLEEGRFAPEFAADATVMQSGDDLIPLVAPASPDAMPTLARAYNDMQDQVVALRNTVLEGVEGSRARTLDLAYDDEAEALLQQWEAGADGIIREARLMSQDVATQTRDFVLHDYRMKRNFDTVASYMYPYQFWYRETYMKMAQRIARNPAIASQYLRYRDYMAKIHADAPEWWKYQVNTNELLGLDWDNPIYFNLEANLNPLNGLTDVDFDDPYKRTGWFTGLVQDMNKFGPSVHTLYSLAIAMGLYAKGEEEAANRWAGRIIPFTRTLKAATGLAFDKPIELDPWVALMADGHDPYERRRIGRALMSMTEDGYTEAEILDASYNQEGPLYDAAVLKAIKARAPGQISSFFLGAGFKARSQTDMQIDHFYDDWYKFWDMEPNLSPDEVRRGLNEMRETYPFMDALLLSRKGGLDRDRNFAYNVLGRIPPSMGDDIAEAVGVDYELFKRFYDDKGHMEEWAEQDAERFMAGIIDAAAVLDMPDGATRDAWESAKSAYGRMQELGRRFYGADIWDLENTYYALMGDTQEDRDRAYAFMDENPTLREARQWKAFTIFSSPTLSQYYTSLDKIESYYKGNMYKVVEEELGKEIWDLLDRKYGKGEKMTSAENAKIRRYYAIKDTWEQYIAESTIRVANTIRQGPGPSLREVMGEMGFTSENVEEIVQNYPPSLAPPPEMLETALGERLFRLYQDGPPYPDVLIRRMESLGMEGLLK